MKFFSFLFIYIFLNNILFSSTGSIIGTIVDKSTKQPIFGVSIILFDPDMNLITGLLTSPDGSFTLSDIETGTYIVRISLLGFRTLFKNRIVVKSNTSTYLEIELEEKPIEIEGITVRPDLFEKPEDVVVSSRSMDFEEIISQPGGAYDVQRAVQAFPAVVSGADQNNEIIVRGGNFGENLFLIDNIELPNPNHFGWQGTGGGPITILNTDFIRHIDFIAGAAPARYGDKASSVLNIEYREGAKDRFHIKMDLGMAGIGGSIEGPIALNGTYLISAHRSYLSLVASSFGLTAIPHYYDIQGKISMTLSNRNKLTFIGIHGGDWITIETGETGEEIELSKIAQIEIKSSQYTFGVNFKTLFGRGYSNITLYRTINYWDHYLEDTLEQETIHHKSNEGEYTVKFDLSYSYNINTKLSLGVFAKSLDHFYDTWMLPDTVFIYDSTGQIIDTTDYIYSLDIDKDERSIKYGGYLQIRQNLGSFLTATLGLRYDYFKYTEHSYFSPRASLSFHILDGTDLNMAYGKHYQSPQWFELVRDPDNHYLESKYTEQYVIGIDHLFSDNIRGTFEVYYKYYQDVPLERAFATPDPNDWDNVYLNIGEGYSKGIELFLQKKVMRNFWGTISYSYSISRAFDPRDQNTEYSWDFDYGNVFTLVTGYRKEFKGSLWYENFKNSFWYKIFVFLPFTPADISEYTFKFRYLGGKPYTPETWHPEWRRWTLDEIQDINPERLKPYMRFDIMLSQRWFYNNWSLKSYFEIENVFNHPNIWDYLYKDNGERETIYQFGRMIIGGVIVEF